MITKRQKDQWVAALRSGKYKQTKGRLRRGNQHGTRYCCLGVAQKLFNFRKAQDDELLSCSVIDLNMQSELAGMNDQGETFLKIADRIERMSLKHLQP